jgi:hypothetical protein
METCRFCGAHLFEGAEYCSQCFAAVEAGEEEVAAGLVEVHAAGGRWRDPKPYVAPWEADARHTSPKRKPVFSRWRAGAFSFSTPVKLAISFLVVVAVPMFFWVFTGGLAIGSILIWFIVVPPRVLRDLWRRTRVQ